jgi:hypothetical protein
LQNLLNTTYKRFFQSLPDELRNWFQLQKEAIDREMEEPLSWQPLEHRGASRICAVHANTTYADAASRADELRIWSVDHLLRSEKVLGPKLSEALAATTPAVALEVAKRKAARFENEPYIGRPGLASRNGVPVSARRRR